MNNPTVKLLCNMTIRMLLLIVGMGALTRVVMICMTGPATLDMSLWQYLGTFFFGAVNDFAFGIVAMTFLMLFALTITDRKFAGRTGYILLGILVAVAVYVTWFCPTLQDFNKGLARVVRWLMLYWIVTFALRMFVPRMRHQWTRTWLAIILFIYVFVVILNATAEYFFWDEFQVRYNFIAVDYLVYTTEVIGNIMESYPMVPITAGMIAVTALIEWWLFRKIITMSDLLYCSYRRGVFALAYIVAAGLSILVLVLLFGLQNTGNAYYNELQANGPFRFGDAFLKNRLDYHRFYTTIPADEASAILDGLDSESVVTVALETDPTLTGTFSLRPNIVLITLESMSADYLERFGGTGGLTPNLDSLYNISIGFDKMIANGNRTVRGLEALSLGLPPAAGQSLIKRPETTPKESVGGVLRKAGYEPYFLYGGRSYFDNMGPFFDKLGYHVIDQDSLTTNEITFSNVWGICDEDAYNKALDILDRNARPDKPVFLHMMSISNHRPYTYPEGRIDIPADSKKRAGGVKYSDYALGQFMRQAATKPWFDNTIFVIVADHCASSAGSTELPLDKYHIPAIIHAPKVLKPITVDAVTSQIDLMPTTMSLAGLQNTNVGFGRNIFGASYHPRAFLATYQDLGYLDNDVLTVLSPVNRVRQYTVSPTDDNPFNIEKTSSVDSIYTKRAVSFYQTSADMNQ